MKFRSSPPPAGSFASGPRALSDEPETNGRNVALAALKQTLAEKRASHSDIRRFASICRVENVMRPYMEALAL